ncbi:hypothetical protein JXZ92_03265 [Mycoplasma sp. CSL10137]|uniref:MAGa3780 family membrane protein n=1 Tax=unclassified Mycoplasma TaxID=2683645 RepID=UPI00197B77D8|nr:MULTISPECIES: hypothetical protein [unclassified Mycoplasma]MBN4083820.1 hypothetical protein [Mycoplasma sp. CSL10137]MBN4084221.1 hypothetical protein [Mycoplasma sp. CSL10166]MBU4692682.1 hypothetical protein [Mycoplasma sp. CSL7491-lung]
MKTLFKLDTQKRKIITLISVLLLLVITNGLIITWMTLFKNSSVNHEATTKSLESYFFRYSQFFYFTNLTNYFSLITLLLMCFSRKNIIRRLFFHSLILISITFLVYWGLISWTSNWKNIFQSYKSLHTHLINPMIIFIFAFIWKDKLKILQKDKFICLIYVFSYLIFAFLLFISTYYLEYNKEYGVVIYPFLDFFHPFFYKGNNLDLKLILNLVIILIGIGLPILIFKFWYRVLSINKKTS